MNAIKLLSGILVIAAIFAMQVHGQPSFVTNGLVAYYPFNGNANDASGNGNDGTVYGATLTIDRFGLANQAYYFDGASAYITTPLSSIVFSNDFTVSTWFNANDIANPWPTLLYEQNGSLGMGIVGASSGTSSPDLIGHIDATCSYAPATFSWQLYSQKIPLNTYCHIVVTKAGTNVTMYMNGQPAVSGQVANPSTLAGQYITIGRIDVATTPTQAYSTFHGVIDDIRIYSRALSASEVQQLYLLEAPPIINIRTAVYFDSPNLRVGTNYQVQTSSDLNTWSNFGPPFIATNSYWRETNYWDVTNANRLFFRLQVSP